MGQILPIRWLRTDLCCGDGKKTYCSVPHSHCSSDKWPPPCSPQSRATLSLDKGQGKQNKIYKSQRQSEEEPQGMQEKPTWENVACFSNACYFVMAGWEPKGHWGAGGGQVATVTQAAWRGREAMGFSTVGPALGKAGSTGLEILVWFLHSPQLLLNRHH